MSSQFLRHSFHSYLTQLLQFFLQALIAIFTARLLGPANKGIFSVLILMSMLAVTLGRCGLGNAAIYFAGRVDRSALIVNGFLLMGMAGLAGSLLSLLAIFLFKNNLLRGIPLAMLTWIVALIPVFFIFDLFAFLFVALMQLSRRNLLIILFPLCQLILLLVTVALLKMGLSGALLSLSLALLLSTGIGAVMLARETSTGKMKADTALMGQLLNYGLKSHLGSVMEMLNYRGDFLIVNFFLGPAAVGYYSVAVNLAEVVWRFPDAIVLVLMPRVARMDGEQAKTFTARVCRLAFGFILIICLIMALGSRFMIRLFFGTPFLPALDPFLCLLPGFIAFAIWKIVASDLVARGHPWKYSSTAGLAFAVMVLLDLWLIPARGIVGAAIASSVAYLVAAALVVAVYARVTRIRALDLLWFQRGDFRYLVNRLREKERTSPREG